MDDCESAIKVTVADNIVFLTHLCVFMFDFVILKATLLSVFVFVRNFVT